ncbi:MAG: hypothetical protein RL329_4155 [Bacteroidota bacterium]
MNLNLKQILMCSSLIVLFGGCETVVLEDFSIPYEGKKGVLIGFVSPENGLLVYAGTTVPVLNSRNDSLKQPILDLLEDGLVVEKPTFIGNNSWNSDTFRPKMGKSYQLTLKSDEIGTVRSDKVSIPIAVRIDTVRVLIANDSITGRVQIDFKDPIGNQYYGIEILQYYKDTLVKGYNSPFFPIQSRDIFKDIDFEGRNTSQEKWVYLGYAKTNQGYKPVNKFKIILYTLSKSGYDFFNGLEVAGSTGRDYFVEPSKIPSNVIGGYGCLSAYSFTTFDVKF